MLLGFKTELKLNARQRVMLAQHCGVARHAWNWGLWLTKNILDHHRANPSEKLKFPTANEMNYQQYFGCGCVSDSSERAGDGTT